MIKGISGIESVYKVGPLVFQSLFSNRVLFKLYKIIDSKNNHV
jgi:hypothetical protein